MTGLHSLLVVMLMPLNVKADYMSYYDNDSTTGCPNYGTTDHTVKINGSPLPPIPLN